MEGSFVLMKVGSDDLMIFESLDEEDFHGR